MARSLIQNVSGAPITLPFYGVLLGPGKNAVVSETVNGAIDLLGGKNAIDGLLRVSEVAESNAVTAPSQTPSGRRLGT